MRRHIGFLKSVFLHSISAFGGPQGHLGMMIKTFVEKRKDLSLTELMDINAFCQIMPGATSTQTLTLIGYKRGGSSLAILTLLIWMFPAVSIMSFASFLITSHSTAHNSLFLFMHPMALGFLLFASIKATITLKSNLSRTIMILTAVITFIFFKSPWIFPIVLVFAIILSISYHKSVSHNTPFQKRKIRWPILFAFVLIFIATGWVSETARKNNWHERTPFNLFENMYRFGSIVFGGADVLIPVMYEQYVVRPTSKKVSSSNQQAIRIESSYFLTGAGFVRAIPGPAFSFAAFIGGLAMSKDGFIYQLLGCMIGAFAVFLPSSFLVLFFYPIWENLHRFNILQNVMYGINASVVGIMVASIIYLTRDTILPFITTSNSSLLVFIFVFIATFLLLYFTKIPAPVIAVLCLLLGYIF